MFSIFRDRTRILVTHSVSFLDQMDQILVFRDGAIAERGSYAELKASKVSIVKNITKTFGA